MCVIKLGIALTLVGCCDCDDSVSSSSGGRGCVDSDSSIDSGGRLIYK